MVSVVFVAKIKPGLEKSFEAQFTKLLAAIAKEPGCKACAWGPTEVPSEYSAWERYSDMAALEAHRASEHVKELVPALHPMFLEKPLIKIFEER